VGIADELLGRFGNNVDMVLTKNEIALKTPDKFFNASIFDYREPFTIHNSQFTIHNNEQKIN